MKTNLKSNPFNLEIVIDKEDFVKLSKIPTLKHKYCPNSKLEIGVYNSTALVKEHATINAVNGNIIIYIPRYIIANEFISGSILSEKIGNINIIDYTSPIFNGAIIKINYLV